MRGVDGKGQNVMGWEEGVAELFLFLEGNVVPSGKVLVVGLRFHWVHFLGAVKNWPKSSSPRGHV